MTTSLIVGLCTLSQPCVHGLNGTFNGTFVCSIQFPAHSFQNEAFPEWTLAHEQWSQQIMRSRERQKLGQEPESHEIITLLWPKPQ